ncbi:microcystin-dependent protein [Breznakibacter xylanolyticus]|uniref:Microcystin-dependent protein n=1 Tax=Breznakibacter xylanolyticus TaxID=990 RepID=A0A2W7NHY1_9BACT|nr:tail fiber protein [Breznakibacter xylanolyticus]PZX17837.1 microcystin-dependent protein [Breznakibacter xylanolyticus]
MDEAYLGTIVLFAGNYAPMGWMFCDGQILNINQYNALFSLLGTTYGGNGTTTFALPDLRGRVPAGPRQGNGLIPINLGQALGSNTITLTTSQLPAHNHPLNANASATGRNIVPTPQNNYLAPNQDTSGNYAATADVQMNAQAIGIAGTATPAPVNNMQPTLGLNYIICCQGLYPARP